MAHKVLHFLRTAGAHLAQDIAAQYAALKKTDHGLEIDLDWSPLAGAVQSDLSAIYVKGGTSAHADTGNRGMFDAFNDRADEYARQRAAELVGKRWVNGELVDNPNAEWAITDTTRERLRDLVGRAFEDGLTPSELQDAIESMSDFSEERAEMIARTELSFAQSAGSIEGWRESGVVAGKQWLLGSEHDGSGCDCEDNEADGVIDLDDLFSSGDDAPPAHPHCVCVCVAVLEDGSDAEEE